MLKLTKTALVAPALTPLPAIAADYPTRAAPPPGSSTKTTPGDDAMPQQCQKNQGAEREQCVQRLRTGQIGRHPALPGGGTTRQEVPGTGTAVPK